MISKTLSDAIESKNVSAIRSVFYTIAHEDPNFSTGKFFNTLNHVKKHNIPGLFEKYDGEEFKTDDWNEAYWSEVAVDLLDNFCIERINHLKEVGEKVYPKKNNVNVNGNMRTSTVVNTTQPQLVGNPYKAHKKVDTKKKLIQTGKMLIEKIVKS